MALLDDVFNDVLKGGNIANGLLIGAAFGLTTRVVGPAILGTSGAILRPALKTAIKGGIVAWDYGRRLANEVVEQASDVVAEARHERQASTADHAAPGAPKPGSKTMRSATGGTINEVPDTAG